MQAFLDRIAALNPRHNAIVSLRDGDELLLEADRLDLELVRNDAGDSPRPFLFGLPQASRTWCRPPASAAPRARPC